MLTLFAFNWAGDVILAILFMRFKRKQMRLFCFTIYKPDIWVLGVIRYEKRYNKQCLNLISKLIIGRRAFLPYYKVCFVQLNCNMYSRVVLLLVKEWKHKIFKLRNVGISKTLFIFKFSWLARTGTRVEFSYCFITWDAV